MQLSINDRIRYQLAADAEVQQRRIESFERRPDGQWIVHLIDDRGWRANIELDRLAEAIDRVDTIPE